MIYFLMTVLVHQSIWPLKFRKFHEASVAGFFITSMDSVYLATVMKYMAAEVLKLALF
jgi:hypothetical protein